jgi:hypothetical protein
MSGDNPNTKTAPLLSAALMPALLVGLFASTTHALIPLRDWDHWWHMIMARVASAGQATDRVHFLYTMDPHAYSYVQPWLSQHIFVWMQDALGDSPAIALATRDLLMGASFTLAAIVAWRRSGSALIGAALALWGQTLTASFFGVRTFMLPWPLFLACLAITYAARAGRLPTWTAALALPACAALWANLHGTFLIPACIALAALTSTLSDRWLNKDSWSGRDALWWATTLALCLIAPICNPMHHHIYSYMVMMARSPALAAFSGDWFPMTPLYPDTVGAAFYLTLISGLALWAITRRADPPRADVLDLLLLAGFGALAIRQCREIIWFGLVAPIAIAPALRGRVAITTLPPGSLASRPATGIAALLLASAIALIAQPWSAPWREVMLSVTLEEPPHTSGPQRALVPAAAPYEAISHLKAHHAALLPTLRVFCAHNQSGYVLYHLQDPARPSPMVFTDNRYELPSLALWDKYYTIAEAKPGWDTLLKDYGVHAVLAGPDDMPALVDALKADPRWRAVPLGDARTQLFLSNERVP